MEIRLRNLPLIAFVAIFTLAASWGMTAGLPHVTFSNETEQVFFALKFASGDLNPRLFVHPPLLAYLLCGAYGATFVLGRIFGTFTGVSDFERLFFTNPTLFYLIARIFILILAAFSLLVFHRLSRRLYGRTTVALLATAFLASSATHVAISHYGAPDILMMFLSLLAFFPITVILRGRGKRRHYALAGLLGGLAISAKYNAYPVCAALFLAHLLRFPWKTAPWREAVMNGNLSTGGALIFFGFFLGSPYSILDFETFFRDFQQLKANAVSTDYLFAHLRPQDPGIAQLVGTFFPSILGRPLTLICGIGLLHAIWRRRFQDLLLSIYIVGYSVQMAPHNLIKPYYFVHVLPFLFLLAARTCVAITDKLPNRRLRPAALAFIFIGLAAQSWAHIIHFDQRAAKTPAVIQAKRWIEANVKSGTGVAVFEGMPLNPNIVSLERQIAETESRGLGAGVRLRKLKKYVTDMEPTYDIHEFPNPWRKDFLAEKFNFASLQKAGVQYVVLDGGWERYLALPSRFQAQAELHRQVIANCGKEASFRQAMPDVDLGTIGQPAEGYVEIFKCLRGRHPTL